MKLVRLSSILHSIKSHLSLRNSLGVSSYSTTTATSVRGSMSCLYRKISPIGDPTVSIVPVLDQWVQDGGAIDKETLQVIIKELRFYKRFAHALQISMWMTDKRYFQPSASDAAVRLDLISKVHGIEQAEIFFNSISTTLRTLPTYTALLKCYALEWESKNSHYDIRIPNFLMGAYCRRGLMEKAETFVDRIISKGGKLDHKTWFYLATGYLQNNQLQKAVEKMKEAIAVCHNRWKPRKDVVAACLEYFKLEGDVEEARNFINLLRAKNIISVDVQDRLLNNFLCEEPNLDARSELNAGDALAGDGEALSEPEVDRTSDSSI
ncbi:hypothetical protein Dsin_006982 [Dipteronia sinensis]|uniref:Pentatricopeptide repeat-containing protein n=1 Tax=Dipteronia sinensis TaxID=43782 RepID=A0AAE0B0B2_9ROSI|nr:hypothetical protein Dsin_006982 [Dipteronia sinensis]